jgi:hypothetical protein
MAFCISHFFPGGTKDQYEAAMIALNGRLGKIPDGQIFHVAGPAPGGWQVTAVQETRESWETFLNDHLIPVMSKGVPGGFTTPPAETEFDVTHFYKQALTGRNRARP